MDPGIPRPDDFESGDPLSADSLNEWAAHVSGSPTYPGGGLHSASGASGSMMRLALPRRPIMALLSGSSSPYSWTQKVCTAAGTLATGPLSGTNAYETNSTASLGGNTVRLFPDGMGGWWFTSKCCTASCTGTRTINVKCGGVNLAGATVTITQGATSYTLTTDASGNAVFTPGASGSWSVSATKSGYTTGTNSFVFTCGTTGNTNVTVNGTTATLTGTIRGCNTVVLPGATVTVTDGATTLATATTDGSGNYTATWSSAGGTFVTVTVTYTLNARFASNSASVSIPSCNGTATRNAGLSPATGYQCDPCGGVMPISETLTLTPPFGSPMTLTWGAGSGWSGSHTPTYTAAEFCDGSTTSKTSTIFWRFSGFTIGVTSYPCGLEYFSVVCGDVAVCGVGPFDGQLKHPFPVITCATSAEVYATTAATHTNAPFSATWSMPSMPGTIGTGTATITE